MKRAGVVLPLLQETLDLQGTALTNLDVLEPLEQRGLKIQTN